MIYPFLVAHPESANVVVHVPDIGNVDEMRAKWPDGEPLFVADFHGRPLTNITVGEADAKIVVELTLRQYCMLFQMELAC